MYSYTSEASVTAKILQNPGGRCTTVLADIPKKQGSASSLPPRSYTSGTLQSPIFGRMFILLMHCRVNQEESSEGSQSRRQHGPNMAMRHVHTEPISMRGISRCNPVDSLQVTEPSQRPRVDVPHPASIARTRPAVAGSARKGVAHAVRNSAGVSDRHDWKFAQDALNGNDIQDRFLVVKLVYHPGSNRLQPSYNTTVSNNCNNCNNCNNTHKSNKFNNTHNNFQLI